MKTYLLAASLAILASSLAPANALDRTANGLQLGDTTICLVPPAPDRPCVPRLNLNPPNPRKRSKTPGHADVPVDPPSGMTTFHFPAVGAVDGDSGNTRITVPGNPPVLAESPRNVIVNPVQTAGPSDLKVNGNGTEANGDLRNINIRLSAPRTGLSRGERGTLKAQVEGLQGLSKTFH